MYDEKTDSTEVVANELALFHKFSDITRSQLRELNQQSGACTLSMVDGLRQMDTHVSEIVTTMNGLVREIEAITRSSEVKFTAECDNLVVDQHKSSEQLEQTLITAQRLFPYVNEVREVAEQIRIISLNMGIEAAHIGSSGGIFSLLGTEVTALSLQATDLSNRIKHDIKAIFDEIRSHITAINERSSYRNKSIRDTVRVITQENSAFVHALTEQRERVRKIGEEVGNSTMSLLGAMQLQDVARQQIEHIDKALGSIDEHNETLIRALQGEITSEEVPSLGDLLEGLYSQYVMESQRRAHSTTSGEESQDEVHGIELF